MTADDYLNLPCPVVILPDHAGGEPCYVAFVSLWPGCMAQGETPADAQRNLEDAKRDYVHACLEYGLDIPYPPIGSVGAGITIFTHPYQMSQMETP